MKIKGTFKQNPIQQYLKYNSSVQNKYPFLFHHTQIFYVCQGKNAIQNKYDNFIAWISDE